MTEVHYFVNVLSAEGLKLDLQKVAAIRGMNTLRNKSEIEKLAWFDKFPS